MWSGTEEVTGRAEDGAVIVVRLSADLVPAMEQYWPATGLRWIDGDGDLTELSPPEKWIELRSGEATDEPAVMVDGRRSGGGWLRFESELSLFAVDHLRDRVAIHAGLVVIDGRTLLLPGSTHAGKSTLCLAFADSGANVLSDEYAMVDPATGLAGGWVRPMRRRLLGGGVQRVPLPPSDGRPVLIDHVAALRYEAGADTPAWVTMTSSEVVFELLRNTVSAQRHPDRALTAALAVARRAEGIRGSRGDFTDTMSRLNLWLHAS